jgi:hypothetical protein
MTERIEPKPEYLRKLRRAELHELMRDLESILRRVQRYARPNERKETGLRLDPATAEVFFLYGETLDPYGEEGVPAEYSCVGRVYFAFDPADGVAVWFGDLPEKTRDALELKRSKVDYDGWRMILPMRRGA